jgi:hypothetical protein
MLRDLAAAAVGWLVVMPQVWWDSRHAPGARLRILLPALVVYFVTTGLL